jgi:hypothetical protein
MKMTEAGIAAAVVQWLGDNGWDVYQEVQPRPYGRCADIVATAGSLLWIIECKTSLGLAVMGQALLWHGWAHRVSVATPRPQRRTAASGYANKCLKRDGTGLLCVMRYGLSDTQVSERVKPALRRATPMASTLRQTLSAEHKTFAAAGNAEGRRWTPFRRTVALVLSHVKQNPGSTMREIIDAVEHHYCSDASARSCIARLTQDGVIAGLRAEHDGKVLRFYQEMHVR